MVYVASLCLFVVCVWFCVWVYKGVVYVVVVVVVVVLVCVCLCVRVRVRVYVYVCDWDVGMEWGSW